MLVIDQHAAHEKILYLQFMRQAEDPSRGIEVQPLLIPHQLELAPGEAAALEGLLPALMAAGFEIEPFGDRTYLVQAIPTIFERLDVPAFLRDLIDDVGQGDLPRELRRLRERICARAACRAAVKAGDALQPAEMQRLLEQLLTTSEALRCPHGRPTVLLLTRDHLDRQFGRLG
jgi:DNA mismatch repair protein MutL